MFRVKSKILGWNMLMMPDSTVFLRVQELNHSSFNLKPVIALQIINFLIAH